MRTVSETLGGNAKAAASAAAAGIAAAGSSAGRHIAHAVSAAFNDPGAISDEELAKLVRQG